LGIGAAIVFKFCPDRQRAGDQVAAAFFIIESAGERRDERGEGPLRQR
jgi:hypothetical protein